MRYIFSLAVVFSLAVFMACQTASSSTTETEKTIITKNEKKVEKKTDGYDTKELTKRSTDSHEVDDGHGHEGETKRISLADAKKAFDAGEALFVDTRPENSYVNEHIKGAINIPVGDFEKRYKEVPKNKKIIAYCS